MAKKIKKSSLEVPHIKNAERKPQGKRMPFRPKSEKFSGHKHSRFDI